MELGRKVAALEASHQILLIGISTAPQACVRADEDALTNLFPNRHLIGLPNYANRRVMLPLQKQKPTDCTQLKLFHKLI